MESRKKRCEPFSSPVEALPTPFAEQARSEEVGPALCDLDSPGGADSQFRKSFLGFHSIRSRTALPKQGRDGNEKTRMCKTPKWLFVTVGLLGVAWGQTANVSPADSQFTQNYGVDGINLQNLSINVTVPVISKPGAVPLVYALSGTNGCQGVIVTNQPVSECGFTNSSPNRVQLPGNSGDGFWILYWGNSTNGTCAADGHGTYTYSNFYLSSPTGLTYYLPPTDYVEDETVGTACLHSLTDYTTVGGIKVGVNTNATLASLTLPNGSAYNPVTGAITDTFGNKLSKTGAGVYTDTLSNNTFSVTASSGSTGEIDQYQDTGVTNRQIKQILTPSETVRTTFGCSQYTNYAQTLAGC